MASPCKDCKDFEVESHSYLFMLAVRINYSAVSSFENKFPTYLPHFSLL